MISEKLVVITSFPPKGIVHDKSVVGIASYAKNTLLNLKKYKKELEITVLAEILNQKESYEDENILVKRAWKRGTFRLFPHLFGEILALKDTKSILIEFEVAMFGDFLYLLPFPIFLLLLKLMGKKITIVSHQVILDISELSGHLNLNNKFKAYLLNFCIHSFYRIILLFSSRVIVFDKILKDNLSKFGNPNKIKIISHGVEEFKNHITRDDARKKLNFLENDFILLYFGYIAWYKGADLLVNAYGELKTDSKIKLIIAGGPNPNHANKVYYQNYIHKIENECQQKGILLTGFVKEENIPLYFLASDVVVFPYRTLMSASGPLSIAFSFQKPFLVSKELSLMFETEDLKMALDELEIDKTDLIFSEDFKDKIKKIQTDSVFRQKIEQLSQIMAEKRNWNEISKIYYETLFK